MKKAVLVISKTIISSVIALLLIYACLSSVVLAECEPLWWRGRTTDEDGYPIEGVAVHVYDTTLTKRVGYIDDLQDPPKIVWTNDLVIDTGSDGWTGWIVLHNCTTYKVTYNKYFDGIEPKEEFIHPNTNSTTHETILYPREEPQGGIADPIEIDIPVDKLALLATYIALASTILVATAATAIYVKRRKKRQ